MVAVSGRANSVLIWAPSPASSCSRCARLVDRYLRLCLVCIRKNPLITLGLSFVCSRLVAFRVLGFFGKISSSSPAGLNHQYLLVVGQV